MHRACDYPNQSAAAFCEGDISHCMHGWCLVGLQNNIMHMVCYTYVIASNALVGCVQDVCAEHINL